MLDDEQRTCVLSDEDYTLIIAGAGAGKTTTIAAKIKYLVDIKKIDPKEILVVSFTNKAVGELKERVNQQLKINCPITTFHSTGIAIIKKDTPEEKITPATEGFLYFAVRDYLLSEIKSNNDLLNKMILLFGSYFETPFEEGNLKDFYSYLAKSDFSTMKSTLGDYNREIIDARTKRHFTIRDERVKSQQEVQIANFLYMNNIDYEYEPIYPFYIEGSDKLYTPDFLIKQDDKKYYIEHFALSQSGQNSRFTQKEIDKYKSTINDKIKLHRKYNTNLIYTWSKYNDGRELLVHLEEDLLNAGFKLNKKTSEEIFEKVKNIEENKYISPLIRLVLTFISNYKVNGYNERHFSIMRENTSSVRTKLFLEIAEGSYSFYEQRLRAINKVDFADMINESARLLKYKEEMKEKLNFKYIFVDEYQDISKQRFDLTNALSKVCDAKVIAVGDDWQSIYAFSGSDITLFTQFKQKMGYAELLKIRNTYRNPQEVIDIAGGFIQENENQVKKDLISHKHIEKPVVILTYSDKNQVFKEQGFKNGTEARAKVVEDAISKVVEYNKKDNKPENSSILLIGRYGFDALRIGNTSYFDYNENTGEIKSKKYPKINLSFLTAHSSKGLGFDNVIIINAIDTMYGFPAQLQMDPVLQFVIHEDKSIEYAEERRLFYVAMTRTKNRVFIVAPTTSPSQFVIELKERYSNVTVEGILQPKVKFMEKELCPVCGYPLQLRFNKNYGLRLYMCTNDPEICEYITNEPNAGKISICKCIKCKDGFLIVKKSTTTNGYFLGCTNYKTIKCKGQMSIEEYLENKNIKNNEPIISNYNRKVELGKAEDIKPIKDNTFIYKKKEIDKNIDNSLFYKFYDELLNFRIGKKEPKRDLYFVMPEAILYEIYKEMPLTIDELEKMENMGSVRIERYGDELISIVNKYLALKPHKRINIKRKLDKNPSVGAKWTIEEENQLKEEFSNGMTIAEIAKAHGRKSGGITARLKKLGLIE